MVQVNYVFNYTLLQTYNCVKYVNTLKHAILCIFTFESREVLLV